MKSIKNIVLILFFTGASFASSDASHSDATWMNNWLKPDPGIFLWTIVTFFIVLIILKAKAWGPLMDALDKREAEIKNSLEAADKARKEADAVSQEYDEMVKKAQIEAHKIVTESKSAGERVKAEIEKKAKLKADEMLQKAKEQIETEKEKAVKEIKSVIVELSISAASKVIEKNLDSDDNKKLIESTLNDIGRA